MKSFEERIAEFKSLIEKSSRIVFFGGAGVSTESGIPDFRSKDGLYNQHDVKFDAFSPEYLLSIDCLWEHPKVFYEFYRQKLDVRGIEPNITHKRLADLEQKGKLSAVITQNIDGLHQKAGSVNVYEVHGTTEKNFCSACATRYPATFIFDSSEDIPHCTRPGCRGTVRPEVTLYGESLPKDAWQNSIDALSKADLLIIGGTSGVVYPANTLVRWYKGKDMVIINKQRTDFDRFCTLVFHESLGEVWNAVQ